MSEGGVVIIDDYALPGCKKACDEYLSKIGFEPKMISVAESGGVVFFFKFKEYKEIKNSRNKKIFSDCFFVPLFFF